MPAKPPFNLSSTSSTLIIWLKLCPHLKPKTYNSPLSLCFASSNAPWPDRSCKKIGQIWNKAFQEHRDAMARESLIPYLSNDCFGRVNTHLVKYKSGNEACSILSICVCSHFSVSLSILGMSITVPNKLDPSGALYQALEKPTIDLLPNLLKFHLFQRHRYIL